MIIPLDEHSPTSVYHLMTQTIIPRPIAWILTQNAEGHSYNLAPYSYFTAVASDPPLVLFSAFPKNPKTGELKDTVVNLLRDQSFVIHLADSHLLKAVNQTAISLPYGDSELELIDADLIPLTEDYQRLKQAPIAMACRLYQHQRLGNAPQMLVFGEIKHLYIDDNVVTQDNGRIHVDANKLNPLSRLGAGQFAQLGDIKKT